MVKAGTTAGQTGEMGNRQAVDEKIGVPGVEIIGVDDTIVDTEEHRGRRYDELCGVALVADGQSEVAADVCGDEDSGTELKTDRRPPVREIDVRRTSRVDKIVTSVKSLSCSLCGAKSGIDILGAGRMIDNNLASKHLDGACARATVGGPGSITNQVAVRVGEGLIQKDRGIGRIHDPHNPDQCATTRNRETPSSHSFCHLFALLKFLRFPFD